ncbi:MAG: zinc ribbon domain-containing protein, partial [Verrucomicrobia bacterium]
MPHPPPIPPRIPAAAPLPPPEVQASRKFSCPACGAEATWNPAKQTLVCAFCGTESAAKPGTTPSGEELVREHDLAEALRSIPDSRRGWQATKTEVRCQHCNAISVFDADKIGKRCDFCGASSLVPYSEVKEAFSPESLLAFKVPDTAVRDAIRAWYGSRWFAPDALGTKALTDTLRGIYIPYWTFDAQVHADWTAESGYYYYVTEQYTDANGNTQTRQVQQVRWEYSAGSVDHFFDDELVAATQGVNAALLAKVEPFPTKDLVAYNPAFLAGWTVERYQIDLVTAATRARESMAAQIQSLCSARVPGDTQRNLRVAADWSGQTFKHVLVPVWLLTYAYNGRVFQVVVNGYTGEIAG